MWCYMEPSYREEVDVASYIWHPVGLETPFTDSKCCLGHAPSAVLQNKFAQLCHSSA